MSNGCKLSVKRFKEFLLKNSADNGSPQTFPSNIDNNYNHDQDGDVNKVFLVGYQYNSNTDCPEVKLRLEDIMNGDICNIRYNEKNDTIEYKDANDDWHEIEISTTVDHLTDIGDVSENPLNVQPGYVLTWTGNGWEAAQNVGDQLQSNWDETNTLSPAFILNKPSIPTTLNKLTDVDTDGVENENILVYSAITQTWKPAPKPQSGGATTLSELTDTNIPSTITNGYVLTWDNSTHKWVPQAVTGTPGQDGHDGQDGQDGRSVEDIQVDGGGLPSTVSGATNIYNCIDQNGQVIGSFDVTNGVQGAPGTNGLTPQVRINSATHQLQVSYDGTTWEDKGLVNIQEGGTTNNFAINIKPSSTDCVSLGDAYIDSEGNLMVLMDVVQGTFDNAGNIRGPQGLQGPQGPQGATGATGAAGADGHSPVITLVVDPQGNGETQLTFKADGQALSQPIIIHDGQDGAQGATGPAGQNGQDGQDGADGTTFELYRITIASTPAALSQDQSYYNLNGTQTWQKWDPQTSAYQSAQQPSIDEHNVLEVCPADDTPSNIAKNLLYGTFGVYYNNRLMFCSVKDPAAAGKLVYTLKLYSNIQ